MKPFAYIVQVCLMVALVAGCVINPYVLPIDPVQNPIPISESEVSDDQPREKIVVHVEKQSQVSGNTNRRVYNTASLGGYSGRGQSYREDVENVLSMSISDTLGSLAFFELVPKGDVDVFALQSFLHDQGKELEFTDYVISAKIATLNVEAQRGEFKMSPMDMVLANKLNVMQPVAEGERRYTVTLSIYFNFQKVSPKRTVRTKTISRTRAGLWEGAIQTWLMNAVRECAQEFAQTLGGRYAPEAHVIQTRGGHQVALVALGANYGLAEGTDVNFYTYVDNAYMPRGKRFKNVVGAGRVLGNNYVQEDCAWVEVFDHSDVLVETGMFVEVQRNQVHEFRWRYFVRKLRNLLMW